MGQVPARASLLLIGNGRLANHLSHFLRTDNLQDRLHGAHSFSHWSRRQGVIDPGDSSATTLEELLSRADRVLLAIRDDALEDFARRYRAAAPSTALWVHFSGSAVIDGVWSAHPLCTFAHELYDAPTYAAIPFIIEREGPPLAELIPGLDNPSAAIPRQSKALYHALCVCAGNFTQLLWQQLFEAFASQLDLPPELALPYLRQTARNLEQDAGRGVLTGPLARRDHRTIEHNLAALEAADLTELAQVYRAFLELAGIPVLEAA